MQLICVLLNRFHNFAFDISLKLNERYEHGCISSMDELYKDIVNKLHRK